MKRKFWIRKNGPVSADDREVGLLAISLIDFDYETDNYFIIKGKQKDSRIYKEESIKAYFDTWDEAHEALKVRAAKQLEDAKWSLMRAEKVIEEVNAMTMPNFRSVEEVQARIKKPLPPPLPPMAQELANEGP